MLKGAPSEKKVFNHLEYAILVISHDLKVILCNDAVSQLWELDKNKIDGNLITRLLSYDNIILNYLQRVFQEGKNFTINGHSLHLAPKLLKIVNISLDPVFRKSQKVQNAVITIRDLTQHYKIKEKEQEKAILDSLGTFVSSIAHEIQNPLSGIKGVTQLLQRDLKKTKLPIQSTEMILKELNRIDRLVKQLLLHSQPLPLEYSTINIHELLNTVIWFEENSSPGSQKFQRLFDPSLPEIFADRDKLYQVFLNLIKNAVEASPKEGEIIIRSRYCPKWEILGKQLDIQQEYFLVEVEDHGNGVAPEFRDKLFKPLFTTKRTGHGLGLSISFRIVAEHGGLLQYQASSQVKGEAQGSIFQVYIPRAPSSQKIKIEE
ncbi:MAG: hypothetical protein HQM13_01520 [SAR324 cluster bacterium]|nr:hypothetical protein [SAR324 cluster bacterium]